MHGNQFGRIKEEENKKNKNRRKQKNKKSFAVCQIKAHGKAQALPCALDMAHGKVNFKFRKQSRMKKLSKRKL